MSSSVSRSLLKRAYSTKRPELAEIFPKRKFINRQLFDLDSRLTFRKLYPVYESLYKSIDGQYETNETTKSSSPSSSSGKIPSYVNGTDLLIMKKALEKYRVYSSTINKHLVALENQLVETAAEFGNNDAIALLAFDTLTTTDLSLLNEGDKEHASSLIKGLYGLKHPLTIKLLGDLCLKHDDFTNAKKYYLEYIQLENDTVLSSEVYKQLGTINFQQSNLHDAKLYFLQSIKYGPLDKTLECHYFLGEIFIATDQKLARFHLQLAASKSFRQAFKSLGFLELNYFNNFVNAREWFKMGLEVRDYECLVGLFDTFYKFGKFDEAVKTLKSVSNVFSEANGNSDVLTTFLQSRNQEVKFLMNYQKEAKETPKPSMTTKQQAKTSLY